MLHNNVPNRYTAMNSTKYVYYSFVTFVIQSYADKPLYRCMYIEYTHIDIHRFQHFQKQF